MTIETATQNQADASTAFLRAARAGQLDKILTLLNQDIDINVSNANGLNAMHLASKDGHSEVVNVLLQRGANIDAATKKGNTALHIAALAGQETVVRILVQHAAKINIQSQNGFTPLYMAAQENHDGVVKFLLANGANQSLATEDGFTPLAVAMQQGHEKVVAVLLEADTGRVRLPALHIAAKKDDCKAATLLLENDHNPDVTSKSGFTPLHIAAHYGNEAVAKLLLTKGADVNCSAKHNICPLHVAAKWGKANMVALLTEHGAQVEARTRDGLTPLHCAARSGHEHVVDMLLERGAPISGKSKNGLAPLHMAAQGDHSDAARILLYHRAPVDDLTVDYLTALHVAAHCGHVKVAKLLLDRNADANARALNGFTPLHIACKKNRIKVVELLLKYGASISATTESGLTPLHVAAFMGCMNIVIYLLQHEASPDVPTVRGETPLHLAARANQTDIIRILLRNGAAVDARARENQTALHIASRLGNVDIVLLLVQHGAQLDALTADNYNALHIAAKQHNHEVAAVLLEHGAPPNAVTKKGFTPLHLAAKYGNLKVANLLMTQKGAELDPRGKNGVTPLHVAAQYKHHAVATALLEKGADPKAAAKNGHTPLHIAARKNQMETAAALMEKGAVVDAESRAGCTPLHLAAHQGHAEMCSLLIEQGAEPGKRARSGLAPLHLAAQEDHVPVAKILVNNGAKIDVCTKGGYTPLHVASHFGQTNMVRYLLESEADVQSTTSHGYTALHHAAQQGHINIVNLLLEHKANANAVTNNGQTPLDIAQRLGYVTVMDTLKGVSEPSTANQSKDDKYRPVAPETMYETFMSDSEEEGGEDTMLTDQPYRYLTVDDMKSLGDDSLPIDVTRDERLESMISSKHIMEASQESTASNPPVIEETISPKMVNNIYNAERMKEGYCYNVDTTQPNFLVSFLVDARGGALRGIRGGGVRVIVPPLSAQQPTRITCRYVRTQRIAHMPPLMEGEALASRILELGPVSAKFIGPIILEVPHFASLRGKEREIVVLRSDNGTTWREHSVEAADCTIQDILNDTLDIDDPVDENGVTQSRMTRILTHDFPQYFAIISRIRQEAHVIGPEGGMVSSSVVPQVQAVFPQGALTKKIKVGLQAQTIEADLTAKLLGRGVAVSPVVTVEPRRRKFHKSITLSMPAPRAHSQGMINQYTTTAPTLRLLCSISGGPNRAHWEDVTDNTPLTFVNDCVSFTTTVSARYWLMDCRNVSEATKMATELYREAIHVPFMARFVVYAKRTEQLQASLRIFCVTDDKEDKTLERMEKFTQVAKSKDVEVHEGKPVYLEFGGNFSPVAKSGEQPKLEFKALQENRLQLAAMVRGEHADAVARCQFMREPRRPKGEPPQSPICVLNIMLPEEIIPVEQNLSYLHRRLLREAALESKRIEAEAENKLPEMLTDERITSVCNLLGMDWVPLAYELGISSTSVANIRERGQNGAHQAALMLELWQSQGGPKVNDNSLELALCRIGREDVMIPQSVADTERRIQRNIYQERQSSEEIIGYKSPDSEKERFSQTMFAHDDLNKALEKTEDEKIERLISPKEPAMDDSIGDREEAKYSPEEKSYVDEGSDREPSLSISEESEEEEGIKKSVAERKIQITRKLSSGKVSASKQKRELKEEIIEIKKQINPEIKKFHEQKSTAFQQETQAKLPKRPSEDEDLVKKAASPVKEQPEPPAKEKVLPKAGPRPMQKHVRNESMIRFSSGDFSDVKVPQKKQEEKIIETKETITKETKSTIEETVHVITRKEETIIHERDVAEASLKEKINSFESKMSFDKDKVEPTVKLTEEALKKHSESQREGERQTAEFMEEFIKDQIRVHEDAINQVIKTDVKTEEKPDVADFAAEMMKAEETFQAGADFITSEKYTESYFKPSEDSPKMFTKSARTDSTIVQFSSEEDNEFLKKSTDSETETESQAVTIKQIKELRDSVFKDDTKSTVMINVERSIGEKTISIEKEVKIVTQTIGALKTEDSLRVDSLEDSLQISSDEDAQIQPTDDESESLKKDPVKIIEAKQTSVETKITHARSDSMGSDFSKQSASEPQLDSSKSPKHISQESPVPYSQSAIDKTDSLADSVQSTERDISYVSQTESKVYSKESRQTRSDSLDEASQFSDMEETQIGSRLISGTEYKTSSIKTDTLQFLENESIFSASELYDSPKKSKTAPPEEPAISAKARQFIETVPEDESVQECFFSKRIYSDSLEESEHGTDDSRRPSEADSLKSDKSDFSGRDAQFKVCKISSEIKEGIDEGAIESPPKSEDKTDRSSEMSDNAQDAIFKKVGPVRKHSRNESISITNFTATELNTDARIVPPEIPQRATEFQMFVTEATEEYTDERISSFDREELSDKISSESSREIEVSDKKWSDGGISDRISSEDAVTDKASSEGSIDPAIKASTDTLLGADAKSPDLIVDDKSDSGSSQRATSPLRKIETKFSGLKDMAEHVEVVTITKLDETLRSIGHAPGPKRASSGSTGDGSYDRLGKRPSDAPSLTDSRDYTFEESEDSIPQRETREDMETKAKAILEPIYDKALKTVRGDSLDDVEPFCMDEPSRLPGIQETQQIPEVDECVAQTVEKITSNITVTISGADGEKEMKLSLSKDVSKDGDKDYSVHSSPDEVEEKICTDTDSELDQARVLEIIEPTTEGEDGFIPVFDTRKIKQDSLDDADDLFAEKEGIFEDMEEYAKTHFASTKTTAIEDVRKFIEAEYVDSSRLLHKEVVSKPEEDEQGPDLRVLRSFSAVGATVAASIGIEIKPEDIDAEAIEKLKESAIAKLEQEHHADELVTDASKTLAASIGVEIKPEVHEAVEHHVTELVADASSTLAASMGVELKQEDILKKIDSVEVKHDHHITELAADASSTLAASVGVELKQEDVLKKMDSVEIKHDHHITELVADASSTLAASVGVELKQEDVLKKMDSVEAKAEHHVKEIVADTTSTMAASAGINVKPGDIHEPDKTSPVDLEPTDKIVSEIKDLNRLDRRCSDLLEGISQPGGSLIRIDATHVTPGLSLKFSKTPPPSPVDLIHRATTERKEFINEVRSISPKSPTRHHDDNISFVNVDSLTLHPESQPKQQLTDTDKIILEGFIGDDSTTIISTKESITHQISGKEFFIEKKNISSSDDDSLISAKVETTRETIGEEYERTERETFEKIGEVTHSERSSVEKEQKASSERRDSEIQRAKKGEDDSTLVTTHREFTEQSLYTGRQSKSEEKMTAIRDEVTKKSEVTYSERDLSHEQWGKEYFAEKSELEPMEESDAEFSQSKDVQIESNLRIVEKDETITSEEVLQGDTVLSSTTGFSKEESVIETKDHDDMASDISQDISMKSEVVGKQDSESEMSPKSRSRSLKKEEVYEVDFIKEIKVSTSQISKHSSHDVSQDTASEISLSQHDLPEDDKKKGKEEPDLNKKLSPVFKSEEHIQEHVWEVSLQQQESFDEMASDLLQHTKSSHDEPRSLEIDFMSQSEPKSFTSASDLGITTLASDLESKVSRSQISVASSEDTYCAEAPSENLESMKDSMIKSRESIETEYMIQSLDSQDTETLHKSIDSMSADVLQQSEKDDFFSETEILKKTEYRLIKERSLEDICSSGYDTDLSSAEFLISKLEHERVESEPPRPQPLANLSDLEKTIDEVKQSLEAAHGEIINEKSDGSIKYKQSPSEFQFKLISPDRPEIIHEEPAQIQEAKPPSPEQKEDKDGDDTIYAEIKPDSKSSVKESDSSSKQDDTYFTSDDEKDTAQEKIFTQQEYSDISTGLESGPVSLLDTETEMASDREDSPKEQFEGVKLRPVQKHLKSAQVADRRSASDLEGWSSSGESHYQSFEHTDNSRPLSSDVEVLLTGTTEFQSALTTQASTRSQRTSKDYVTAASTLSSGGSVKSLDSESSSHVASIDISDASETLVPTAEELKEEMIESGTLPVQFTTVTTKIKRVEEEEFGPERVRRPVDSLDHSEEGSLDDEVEEIIESTEIVGKMKRSHEMSFQPKEALPEKVPSDSFSESTDIEIEAGIPESESQVFSMSKIETGPSSVKHIKESQEVSKKSSKSSEPSKSYEISEKIVEYRTSSVVYKTPEKKPKPPVGEVETVIERKVITIKAEPRPVHYAIAPKSQEVDFEALEACIIPQGTAEFEEIVASHVSKSHSGSSSSEKKTPEPYAIDSKQSSSSSLKMQEDFLSTPQTPISNPSQSSESTDNGREYVLDEMYEIPEDPELFMSEKALTDSKSEVSMTTEEHTLYDTQKEPESPISDEFEMVDKPGEMDDFVVIEEVAREAHETDREGKSLSIAKTTYVKKHDEEVENLLSQVTKKTTDSEYSTSGSLSEEELAQYELEQKKLRAQESAEIEAGKRWIQMQFEGDLVATRYEYDRGPLEDIKEEEMTDFDASRIGSYASQKESVGSFGSFRNSYGSMSESEMLRKRYMMRSGDQDDVSVSSLQEFENLEQILSLEAYQHSSSSQDSLNGSLSKRYYKSKNVQGDDVSISSLKEFEGLESACIEALRMEISAKQKEALLMSQDGRLSSTAFLDMERRSLSQGSSDSSPPQKSGSSPGQKSGSPSQKSGSPSQKSGSPGQKSGSPGQKYGSPQQRTTLEAIKRQLSDNGEAKVTTAGPTVVVQKKVFDDKGAFYVPETSQVECKEGVCTKKACYECRDEPETSGSFTESDIMSVEPKTCVEVITEVKEVIVVGKGMDIPGVKQAIQSEFGPDSFQGIEVGSGTSIGDFGSEFSSSITSQQSDTESLVTMMEKPTDADLGSELGSLESLTTRKVVSPRNFELDLTSKVESIEAARETSPMSGKSGSGAFSSTASKHFTDPASGSWSGLDEDMSSSSSFSRVEENEVTLTNTSRPKEDLMLGSTDSLEQTSSNATRATYNYEVDTPMTGSLTSAGSHTMVSSLDTLEPITAVFDKGERTLRLSTEDCFTMDHSGSEHLDYDVHEPDMDSEKNDIKRPQVKERTRLSEGRLSSEDSGSSQSGALFFIGDTPITKGGDKSSSDSGSAISDTPPIPAQRKSISGIPKPIVLEKRKPGEDSDDEENV